MPEGKPKLLIVEDDPGLQKQLKWCFDDYEVIAAGTRSEAISALRRHEPAVVLQDLGLPPDPEGVSEGFLTLVETLRAAPHTKVIVVTGQADRENAVKAVGMGAYDFYQKPVDNDVLRLIVARAAYIHSLEAQTRALAHQPGNMPLAGVIAISDSMMRICRIIEKVAPTMATVLLLGESGTGKEVLARAVHSLSPRASKGFVAINCAAIPDTLLESELFGYEKGAFTGAARQTPGKIELAHGGTLFLDEIGDLPMSLQAKLLRFLQERVIERVGGRQEIPVETRVVCATHQDLKEHITTGRFREDLFYRLAEIVVQIPPLRARPGDAALLAHVFARRIAEEQRRGAITLLPDAIAAIEAHSWPGNVRELENVIKRAVIIVDGNTIGAADLGLSGAESESLNLREVRETAERNAVVRALGRVNGNLTRAAEMLGVSRPTLYDLMHRFGLK